MLRALDGPALMHSCLHHTACTQLVLCEGAGSCTHIQPAHSPTHNLPPGLQMMAPGGQPMFMVRPMGPGQQGMPMPMQASLGAKGLFFHVIRGGTLVGSWWTTGSSAGRRALGLACHPDCSMLVG